MDRFHDILHQLGEIIHVPLYPDKHRACRLNINDLLHVQIDEDSNQERLLIAAFIGDVPPGKFRENLFRECLKANHVFPRFGTLGYSERNNKLTLFEYVALPQLNGEMLADILAKFIEKAESWRHGLQNGVIPPPAPNLSMVDRSIFNLKL